MDEIWKDIEGYEGLYQVSNLGRVKAFAKKGLWQDRILSCANSFGYRMIYLRKNGRRNYHAVHRLVAKSFIPNPKKLPFVNHKNEKKDDNRVDNLEWCDAKYNTNYGTGIKRRAKAQTNRHGSISVVQCSLDGSVITEYPSMMEASRKTNVPPRAICACCKNYQKSAFGYIWKYKE